VIIEIPSIDAFQDVFMRILFAASANEVLALLNYLFVFYSLFASSTARYSL